MSRTVNHIVKALIFYQKCRLEALEFIKNEIMTLNNDYDFSTILGSSNFEAIIDKFLTPFLTGVGFTVNREKNTDCGDDTFIYTLSNITLNLVSAGRLGSGSVYFVVHAGSSNRVYSYSDLQSS